MSQRYVVSRKATADLTQIKAYITRQSGAMRALYVAREFVKAFEFLSSTPHAGHFREDLTDKPLRFWGVFSYLIIYDPAKKPISIARVIHGRRH